MNKYTPDQLRDMARQALQAKEDGDVRWIQLAFQLMMACNMTFAQIELEIRNLAK